MFGGKGKSKDEDNKGKSQQQENLEQSIKDFLDSLPKDDKKLFNYLKVNANLNDSNEVVCFNSSKFAFNNYLNNRISCVCNNKVGYKCISSEQDIKNNKLIIQNLGKKDPHNETDTFILENEFTLKIQQNYENKQYNITVTKPSRNPNQNDPLKSKIRYVLDNGTVSIIKNLENVGNTDGIVKDIFNKAYTNNSFWNFDDDVQTENSVSIVRCKFDENDNITETITYKFILENEKQVRVQKNVNKKMEYEIVLEIWTSLSYSYKYT